MTRKPWNHGLYRAHSQGTTSITVNSLPRKPGTMVSIGPTAGVLLPLTPCPGSPGTMVSRGPTAGVPLTPCPGNLGTMASVGPTAGVLLPLTSCPGSPETTVSIEPTAGVLLPLTRCPGLQDYYRLLPITPCPRRRGTMVSRGPTAWRLLPLIFCLENPGTIWLHMGSKCKFWELLGALNNITANSLDVSDSIHLAQPTEAMRKTLWQHCMHCARLF